MALATCDRTFWKYSGQFLSLFWTRWDQGCLAQPQQHRGNHFNASGRWFLAGIRDRSHIYCIHLHTRRLHVIFYFSLVLHFCNCYSIKMINKSIKLEPRPRGRVSPPASRELAPGTGHALLSRGNLPFPGAGRHSRHGCCKPGWWQSSRQVLVLHWISTLRAGVLDVHVKLLFLTCWEGQKHR